MTPFTIIPAQPGWHLLHPGEIEDGKFNPLEMDPIIAWRIETRQVTKTGDYFDTSYPICANGNADEAWIVCPRGTVTDGHTHTFTTIAEAVDHIAKAANTAN